MRKAETTNVFTDGLVMDFNPLVSPSNTLCNALNATLITRNGNENALLNDMGNGRVETAYLPEGYVPLGISQLGGIIYIVSYNPIIDKCQIGSFPSPERNVTFEELAVLEGTDPPTLRPEDFVLNLVVINTIKKLKMSNSLILHPGDKYIVSAEKLADNINEIIGLNGKYVNLYLATIDDNNRLVTLNTKNIYDVEGHLYFIYDGKLDENGTAGLENYRNLVQSPYQIYSSKISGNLYVIAELNVMNTFNVLYRCTNYDISDSSKVYTLEFTTSYIPEDVPIKYIIASFFLASHNFYINNNSDDNNNCILLSNLTGQENVELTWVKSEENENNKFELKVYIEEPEELSLPTLSFTLTPCLEFGKYLQKNVNISINFELLGTGASVITTWRYYRDVNSMYVVTNLNAYPRDNLSVTGIEIYAIKHTLINNNTNLEDLMNQEYQLENIVTDSTGFFSFTWGSDKLLMDTLYLIIFVTRYSDETSVLSCKCLYTNGVFNDIYLHDSTYTDFDELSPLLNYICDFSTTGEIQRSVQAKTDPTASITDELDYILGADVITYKSNNLLLQGIIGLENDYNSFSVDQSKIDVLVLDETYENKLDGVTSIESTAEFPDNEGYLTWNGTAGDYESDILIPDNLSSECLSKYTAKMEKSGNLINLYINGITYNKALAECTNKAIAIGQLITPAIYNLETASNYGLSFYLDGSRFYSTFGSIYPSIGISSGGVEAIGEGKVYAFVADKEISISGDTCGYGEPIFDRVTPDNDDGGLQLKNGNISDLCDTLDGSSLYPFQPMFYSGVTPNDLPQRLERRISDASSRINSNHVSYKEEFNREDLNYLLYGYDDSANAKCPGVLFPGSPDTDPGKAQRRNNFELQALGLPFLTFELFVKNVLDKMFAIDVYIPTIGENVIEVDNSGRNLIGLTIGDLILSLLCLLYVKRGASTEEGYSIGEIKYYNSLQETASTSFKYNINTTNDPSNVILLDGKYLSDIKSKFLKLAGNKECLNLQMIKPSEPLTYTFTYNINLSTPSILDQYRQIRNNARLDYAVKSYTKVSIPDNIDMDKLIFTVKDGKLSDSLDLSHLKLLDTFIMSGEDISEILTKDWTMLCPQVTLNSFLWDPYSLTIRLSTTYLQNPSADNDRYFYEFNDSGGHTLYAPTTWYPNILLFNRFNIVK